MGVDAAAGPTSPNSVALAHEARPTQSADAGARPRRVRGAWRRRKARAARARRAAGRRRGDGDSRRASGSRRSGVAALGPAAGVDRAALACRVISFETLREIAPLAHHRRGGGDDADRGDDAQLLDDPAEAPTSTATSSASAPPTCSPASRAPFRSTPARRAPPSSSRPAGARSSAGLLAAALGARASRSMAAGSSRMCRSGAGRRVAVRRAAHPARRRDDRRLRGAARPEFVLILVTWPPSWRCRSSRASALGIRAVDPARRVDDDARPRRRVRAHPRHVDLVAEGRAERRARPSPGVKVVGVAGAAVVPQRLRIPAGAEGLAAPGAASCWSSKPTRSSRSTIPARRLLGETITPAAGGRRRRSRSRGWSPCARRRASRGTGWKR